MERESVLFWAKVSIEINLHLVAYGHQLVKIIVKCMPEASR